MIKRSKQKKETDIDFEQRKMLAGIDSLDDTEYARNSQSDDFAERYRFVDFAEIEENWFNSDVFLLMDFTIGFFVDEVGPNLKKLKVLKKNEVRVKKLEKKFFLINSFFKKHYTFE